MFAEIGDLVFSLVVGYMGALEFLYVVRHLYHWSFRHNLEIHDPKNDDDSLQRLQDHLKNSITEANEKEALGLKAMKDGVLYKDGFRIDGDQKEIDELKDKVRKQAENAQKKKEIEAELARQKKIEQETRRQLKEAEDELQRVKEEKERERLKAENEEKEKKMEEKRRQLAEEEENQRRIIEAEKLKEKEQRRREEEEEKARKELEAERLREETKRQQELDEENARKLLEAERQLQEKQRLLEEEEEEQRRIATEKAREEEECLRKIEEENTRKLLEAERAREEAERQREFEEENARILEAEREREERQRQQDLEDERIIQRLLEAERLREQEEEESNRKLIEAEREQEAKHRLQELEEENARRIFEAERELQEEQRRLEENQIRQRMEEEENYNRLLQMERELEEREREEEEERKAFLEHTAALERETAERLLAAERETELKRREIEENEENVRNLLEAERELQLRKREMEEEAENLRRLIEAEREMESRQRKIDEEALEKLKTAQEEIELKQANDPKAEASEQLAIKKEVGRSEHSPTPTQTVKTQYGQTSSESLKPKPLLFPGVSEESSSAEPISSKQSSFSTQQSSEAVLPELQFDEYERQAPDGGEDMPSLQYSDDYLRSLDGIKNKPLVREDGSGRRRAFKKRRSSGSSTSSRESRASREEELKMFTSLEEEESENIRKGESEYETIKYANEPNLKVGKPHRRHKRSPAKDAKRDASDATKESLEMLDEEDSNPWGEIKPEHYKDTEFWKREKKLSIDEELEDNEALQRIQLPNLSAVNVPKMESFEEATKSQHEEVISALQRQRSKDPEPTKETNEESDTKNVSTRKIADARLSPAGRLSSPASASAFASKSPALVTPEPERENSQGAEQNAARTPSPSGTGGGLRRSPRVDEMKQYNEQCKAEDRKARAEAGSNPAIEIEYVSDEEAEGNEYLMEGISDFYDFNASINPSRSRSRSRSKTPASSRSVSPKQRRTPSPQSLSHSPEKSNSRSPSPDPASYKFIYERILPSLAAADQQQQGQQDQQNIDGVSDFYDFNSKLNRETHSGSTTRRSSQAHRTSVDYIIEDLEKEKLNESEATSKQLIDLQDTPTTPEYERSISADWRDIQKLKEELLTGTFKRSTYVGESMDFSDQFESLRKEAKAFRRSRSKSRSPGNDVEDLTVWKQAKKKLQEKILEDITKSSQNSEDFLIDMTKSYVDRNRRASDTVLIQKPEILLQIQDLIDENDENLEVLDLEAEEYHHFRRFSLNQEIPVEQYPEEYEEFQVKSLGDLRTWSENIEVSYVAENSTEQQKPFEDVVEEAYASSGSDDERQTVVEVDDEIDEDIWDYNERPEESYNEQSECEEADREMDRFAGRHADDWRDVEGASGGILDEDSCQIDQIYDEAIKNRKQSGILRDYDSILKEIQVSDEDRIDEEYNLPRTSANNIEHNLLSPRSRSSRANSGDSSRSFLENERRDNEHRYLGDAAMSAINSTRLRSRYGIVPSTSFTISHDNDTTDIDVNYVPKREYNWRKNFKLDDEDVEKENENPEQYTDIRKFSLGGESITLFSQSPEHLEHEVANIIHAEDNVQERLEEEMEEEIDEMTVDKPTKKKKSKRKSRKGSKGSIDTVEEGGENVTRRKSNVSEGDMPKKKSRRGSKENIDEAEDVTPLQDEAADETQLKKKSKKRKKTKQETALPSIELKLPSPEKKAPPPSVAAIRAALMAQPAPAPVQAKPIVIPKKSMTIKNSISQQLQPTHEQKSPQSKISNESPKNELKLVLSTARSSVSPLKIDMKPNYSAHSVMEQTKQTTNTPEPTKSNVKPSLSIPSTAVNLQPASVPNVVLEQTKQTTNTPDPANSDVKPSSLIPTSTVNLQLASVPNVVLEQTKHTINTSDTALPLELSDHPRQRTPSPTPAPQPSTDPNQDKNKSTTPTTPDAYDLIKDGGLYPLF